jgi:hypothetical protein
MKYIHYLVCFCLLVPSAYSRDVFDANTGILTIPEVQIDNMVFTNVKITVGSVVEVGGSREHSDTAICTDNHLTTDAFSRINLNMSLAEVIQLIGCKNTDQEMILSTWLRWGVADDSRRIDVYFDDTGRVTLFGTTGFYKDSLGIDH